MSKGISRRSAIKAIFGAMLGTAVELSLPGKAQAQSRNLYQAAIDLYDDITYKPPTAKSVQIPVEQSRPDYAGDGMRVYEFMFPDNPDKKALFVEYDNGAPPHYVVRNGNELTIESLEAYPTSQSREPVPHLRTQNYRVDETGNVAFTRGSDQKTDKPWGIEEPNLYTFSAEAADQDPNLRQSVRAVTAKLGRVLGLVSNPAARQPKNTADSYVYKRTARGQIHAKLTRPGHSVVSTYIRNNSSRDCTYCDVSVDFPERGLPRLLVKELRGLTIAGTDIRVGYDNPYKGILSQAANSSNWGTILSECKNVYLEKRKTLPDAEKDALANRFNALPFALAGEVLRGLTQTLFNCRNEIINKTGKEANGDMVFPRFYTDGYYPDGYTDSRGRYSPPPMPFDTAVGVMRKELGVEPKSYTNAYISQKKPTRRELFASLAAPFSTLTKG